MTIGSLREYCRLKEWNPGYGHKLKTEGRLVMVTVEGKEQVDFEASDARVAATADPAKAHMAQVNDRQRAMHRGTSTPPPLDHEPVSDAGGSKNSTYMQAKTAREVYEAKNAKLEYEERSAKVIRVDAVKTALATVITATREALLQLPPRLAPRLAADGDPASVQNILHAEIHSALQQLSGSIDQIGQTKGVVE